jgi:hypothetical protein
VKYSHWSRAQRSYQKPRSAYDGRKRRRLNSPSNPCAPQRATGPAILDYPDNSTNDQAHQSPQGQRGFGNVVEEAANEAGSWSAPDGTRHNLTNDLRSEQILDCATPGINLGMIRTQSSCHASQMGAYQITAPTALPPYSVPERVEVQEPQLAMAFGDQQSDLVGLREPSSSIFGLNLFCPTPLDSPSLSLVGDSAPVPGVTPNDLAEADLEQLFGDPPPHNPTGYRNRSDS